MTKNPNIKVIIATGGTGGHIFPALQTGLALRERGHEVIFTGALEKAKDKIQAAGFSLENISAQGLTSRSIPGIWRFGSSMIKAFNQAKGILKKNAPDKVIGFGGYGSFAIVLAARTMKIPAMIHEQNVVPGKANRLLSRWVNLIAVSFPKTQIFSKQLKVVWTGCPAHTKPLSASKDVIYKKYELAPDKKTILVLGGSQGSKAINDVVYSWAMSVDPLIQVIHMTGIKDHREWQMKYQEHKSKVLALGFIDPIEEAYQIADVVISRAGAATVTELGAFGIFSILVPYPHADGHQKYNAEVLRDLGLALIIEQDQFNVQTLNAALKKFLDQPKVNRTAVAEVFKKEPALELVRALEGL